MLLSLLYPLLLLSHPLAAGHDLSYKSRSFFACNSRAANSDCRAPTSEARPFLEGMTALAAPGALPGPLAVFGEKAFVILTAQAGKVRLPLVAATAFGKGRIVAIGHEGFITYAAKDKNNARFVENAIVWAGHGRPAPQVLRVGTFEPESTVRPSCRRCRCGASDD